jgi:hypothetical protein
MHYKVLSYLIYRNDGNIESGLAPYRGAEIDKEALTRFIAGYFAGPEDSYRAIAVEEHQSFPDEYTWIQNVYRMGSFAHLQRNHNYAGDLLGRYSLHL